jgi:hypothetical protein
MVIEYERGDAEAFSYAREIAQTFAAGGTAKIRINANSWLNPNTFGVFFAVSPDLKGAIVEEALSRGEIFPTLVDINLSSFLPRNVVAPNLYIFVAPKPPPPFIVSARAEAHGTSTAQATSSTIRE